VVAACGNGTAGAFAPEALERMGCEVIPLDTELDHTFPRYNPNPEDMRMLHAIRDKVLRDRCRCRPLASTATATVAAWSTMKARRSSPTRSGSCWRATCRPAPRLDLRRRRQVDRPFQHRSRSCKANGATTDYWKTGHSYIKRRVAELGALAGFEKSGHFFFNPPIGRGYDDGIVAAGAVLAMLDRNPGKTLAELKTALPDAWTA
jgi:phosphomannomutase/phosphoglucomutase